MAGKGGKDDYSFFEDTKTLGKNVVEKGCIDFSANINKGNNGERIFGEGI
jgi:hypothetical protein